MNAVTSLPSLFTSNMSNIPVGRFESLCVSGATVAELLKRIDNRDARECFASLITIQPRLRAERLASERALTALTEAKAQVRQANAIADTLIGTAVRVGRLLKFDEITDFENQDDAWLFTVEGLVTALRARGDLGRALADRFAEVLHELDTANAELTRATADHARATAAFSIEYREFAAAVAFGRAIVTRLGIEVPRAAPKKKAKTQEATRVVAPTSTVTEGHVI